MRIRAFQHPLRGLCVLCCSAWMIRGLLLGIIFQMSSAGMVGCQEWGVCGHMCVPLIDADGSDSDEDLRNAVIVAPKAAPAPAASASSSACAARGALSPLLSSYPQIAKNFGRKVVQPKATPPPPVTSAGQVGAGAASGAPAWPGAAPCAAPSSMSPQAVHAPPPRLQTIHDSNKLLQLQGSITEFGLPLLPGVPMNVFWPPPETVTPSGLDQYARGLTGFFQTHWDVEFVKALPVATSRAFQRLPAPVQSAVMDVFRFGWAPMSQMADMVHAFTASWATHHAALSAARVCSLESVKLVHVTVIHVSSGHGTGVGTAHEAMKLLQMAYAPSGLLPVISRLRHYVAGDLQTSSARTELTRCFDVGQAQSVK